MIQQQLSLFVLVLQHMPEDFQTFNRLSPVATRRRDLPHWEQEGCTYFITWRTADSVPEEILRPWLNERDAFYKTNPKPWDVAIQQSFDERFTRRMENWLDAGHGACVLRLPSVREPVLECLRHFDNTRYSLSAWVVMPNHVHVLVRPFDGWPLSRILHTWKSFTAGRINDALGSTGTFWMAESFDHIVRSPAQLERFRRYISENPAKAGLGETEYDVWMGEGAKWDRLPACGVCGFDAKARHESQHP